MYLQEEYCQRHGVYNTPLVIYPDKAYNNCSSLLVQDTVCSRLIVINIVAMKSESRAGYYKFILSLPMRDNPGQQPFWERLVEWDEWEQFVYKWVESNKGSLVPLYGNELALAIWKIWAYNHDTWLANNLLDRHKDNFCSVLDNNIIVSKKFDYMSSIEEYIKGKNKGVISSLVNFRSQHADKTHATWLAKLLQQ